MAHHSTLVDLIETYVLLHEAKDALPNCWTATLLDKGADSDRAEHVFASIEWTRECLFAPENGLLMLVRNNTILDEHRRWTCLYWNRNGERPDSDRLWRRARDAISIPGDLDADLIQIARPLLRLPWPERIESYEQEQENPYHSYLHRLLLYVHQCCCESGDAMLCEYVECSLGGERVGVLRAGLKSAVDQMCNVFRNWAIDAIDHIPTIGAACRELAVYFLKYGHTTSCVRYELSEMGYTLATRFTLLAKPLIPVDTSLHLHQELCGIMEKMHNSNDDDIGRLSWAGYIFCERWRGLLTELAGDTAPPKTEPKSKRSTKPGRPTEYDAEHERRVIADQKVSGMTLREFADAKNFDLHELELTRSRVNSKGSRARKRRSSRTT